jgi:D-alanyl-D-alanine carboxypeptidase/D-alanyl-D-alanine-endopeptidase (penicillin-binding protein 4)
MAHAAFCPAELEAKINAIVDRPQFQRARWGILVQPLGESESLYERNPAQFFIPASNVKLFTSAAAFVHLGAEFRLHTSVHAFESGEAAAIAPSNALVVMGQGDPSLTDAELSLLAQQLRQQGITQIATLMAQAGDTIANPTWEWEDLQQGYGAPASRLIVNQNQLSITLSPQSIGQPVRVQWHSPTTQEWQIQNTALTIATAAEPLVPLQVGRDLAQSILYVSGQLPADAEPVEESIAITQPTAHFLDQFRQQLEEQGIAVEQTAIAPIVPPFTEAIAAIASPPLSVLLETMNQQSNNLYAEALLRILGMTDSAGQAEFTSNAGVAAIEAILADVGVDPAGYRLVDGSGLSRHNLATPAALVDTLQRMAAHPDAAVYRQSLAVAGSNGTLRHRFQNTAVAGRLWGKTGALSGVAALSGYLEPSNHPPLVFSIVLNQFEEPVSTVRPAIDEIVVRLSQLQRCSDAISN